MARRKVTKTTTAQAIARTLPLQKPRLKLTAGQRWHILGGWFKRRKQPPVMNLHVTVNAVDSDSEEFAARVVAAVQEAMRRRVV